MAVEFGSIGATAPQSQQPSEGAFASAGEEQPELTEEEEQQIYEEIVGRFVFMQMSEVMQSAKLAQSLFKDVMNLPG